MPIVGAHILLYTTEPERLRAVLRDVLGWRYVEDPGSEPGWLIFALPAAELGVHPCCSTLDPAEPACDGSGDRLTGDGEIGDRLACFAAPELGPRLDVGHDAKRIER